MASDGRRPSCHVRLRAERDGGGSGRVYTITVVRTDGSNNVTANTVTVNVPESQHYVEGRPE